MEHQELRQAFADRMSELLMQEPPEDREPVMDWIVSRLREDGVDLAAVEMDSPQAFAERLFLTYQGLPVEWIRADMSPDGPETAEELFLSLMPSDGHLE